MTTPPTPARRTLLVVIDGLGAAPLRRALAEGHTPHLKELLAAGGHFDEAISPFPSLTPVCLATIITGAAPDRHRIPSLSWYQRGEGRFVEYGSSFAASAVEGRQRTIEDTVVNLNHMHLAEEPRTLFEVFQDEGRVAASVNFLVWRGRTRHTIRHDYRPVSTIAKNRKIHAVYGPDYFYLGELYGNTRPVLPQIGFKRPKDWGGGFIAKHLLKSTDTEFLLLYLGQHDSASHKLGPDDTQRAIRTADRAMGKAFAAAGGIEHFLRDTAVIICADHAQTSVPVDQTVSLEDCFDDVSVFRGSRTTRASSCDIAISPSNRFAMMYRLRDLAPSLRWMAERAQESPATEVVAFAEDGHVVVRRDGRELRFVHARDGIADAPGIEVATQRARAFGTSSRWFLDGDLETLDLTVDADNTVHYGCFPDALHRLEAGLRCINTGDVLVSAREGWEFNDIGGKAHPGGGSHGSLRAGDSVAPLITAGLASGALRNLPWYRLEDIADIVRANAGLEPAPLPFVTRAKTPDTGDE